jgi:RNA polymerase sigma factor (sigma-70 family)
MAVLAAVIAEPAAGITPRMIREEKPARRDAPAPGGFPPTRFSVVQATHSDDAAIRHSAWEALIRAYWKPVYKYVRIKWQAGAEDAQDLTQAFFLHAMDAGFFQRFEPQRARFRTYLRVCLHGFIANERKAATRKKRGGDYQLMSLDFADAEGELRQLQLAADGDPEEFFRQESLRSLFALAVASLRAHYTALGRERQFALFERYDLVSPEQRERPTYQQLADSLGLTVTQVTNQLAATRRDFRRYVLDHLRAVCGTEQEFRTEAIELLGTDPSNVAV